jgi:hypothetical protein
VSVCLLFFHLLLCPINDETTKTSFFSHIYLWLCPPFFKSLFLLLAGLILYWDDSFSIDRVVSVHSTDQTQPISFLNKKSRLICAHRNSQWKEVSSGPYHGRFIARGL